MVFMLNLATGTEIINVILLAGLIYIYLQNYRRMHSKFALGLFFFAAFFLVQNLMAIYFQVAMVNYYTPEVSEHIFILTSIQTLGLVILSFITWKY